jgi:ABC-type sugar transport system ATPase subunit
LSQLAVPVIYVTQAQAEAAKAAQQLIEMRKQERPQQVLLVTS